jgi:hypothetical protein
MGATALGPSIVVNGETSGFTATAPTGAGIGSVFAVVALVYVLVYFDLADAAEVRFVKRMILASILPLSIVFLSILIYEINQVIIGTIV